jgi:hypothetical protein
MTYKMFLDDIRNPSWTYPDDPGEEWQTCRSVAAAQAMMEERGWPSVISFDHDLGHDEPTGMAFARWLVELDLDTGGMPAGFAYRVHSANPVGALNIHQLMHGYLQHRR